MAVYVAYLILTLWQSELINARKNNKRKAIFVFLSFAELFLLTGLRGYDVGSDTRTYLDYFVARRGISFFEIFLVDPHGFEFGYQIFQNLCAFTGMSETAYLFCVSAAIYAPFFFFVYKYSSHPEISVLLYFVFDFFYYSLGIFRQMIAVSICLFTVPLIIKRKPIAFMLVTLLAASFHETALIWFWIYAIYPYARSRQIWWVMTACILALPVGEWVARPIMESIPRYKYYFIDFEKYRNAPDESFFIFFTFGTILFGLKFFGYLDKPRKPVEQIALACLCMCVAEGSFARFFVLTSRAVTYFSIYLTTLIPSFIDDYFGEKWRYPIKILLSLTLIGLFISLFYCNKFINPFKFFWE